MNPKKIIITVVIIIIVGVAGAYFWKGGFSGWNIGTMFTPDSSAEPVIGEQGAGAGQTNEPAGSGQAGGIGKMTDDIFADMIAHTAYLTQKNNPAEYISGMKSLYEKYGVTEENVNAYSEMVDKDAARTQIITQKYMQKLQELMAAGK